MIYWQNLDNEIVDMIKNPRFSTEAIEENVFYSTANPPKTGMFIVSPSQGGTNLPSRDTFAFVSIFNPQIIEYDNNGTMEQYKVRVTHAMRMTGLDSNVGGMEWFDYTLYKPTDEGWNAPIPVGKESRAIYERIGYTADWVPVDTTIINNLIDGGESSALSAEQGKELKRLIDAIKPFSSEDKAKLDGIEEGANKYELPIASGTVLGGIKIDEESFEVMPDGVVKSKVKPYMVQGIVKEVNGSLPDVDGKVTIDIPIITFTPSAPIIYFDHVDGNDSNVGTESSPKKSILKYIKSLSGKFLTEEHTINIVNKNQTISMQPLKISNISGAPLTIATIGGDPYINFQETIYLSDCSNAVNLIGMTAQSINITNSPLVTLDKCMTFGTYYGVSSSNSNVSCKNCITNNHVYAYYATEHSELFVLNATGMGALGTSMTVGYHSRVGSNVKVSMDNLTSLTAKTSHYQGGTIQEL